MKILEIVEKYTRLKSLMHNPLLKFLTHISIIKIHTDCGKTFEQSQSLNKHLRYVHSK